MKTVVKFAPPDLDIAASGVITATLSTEAEDRDGDVILCSAWDLQHFDKHPVLMANHEYTIRSQIGHWENVRVDHGKLVGEPHYYSGQGNADADWAEALARQGKAAFSVGFVPMEERPRKGHGGSEFMRVELLEVSQVALPSNRDALQNMMKSLKPGAMREYVEDVLTLAPRDARKRQPGSIVRKWESAFMDDDGGAPYGDGDRHCLVPGCDDAAQMTVPICSEHLKVLMNAPAEPPGSPPDDLDELLRALTHRSHRKAGRVLSGASLSKLHDALGAMHSLHDGACDDANCPMSDLPTQAQKAAGEGVGSAGGFMVSEGGTHGAFSGKHSHEHDAAGHSSSADDKGNHDHSHAHDGDGNHGHDHAGANFKTLREREIQRAEQSVATQNDLPDSAFAVISPGGEKDADGRTTPRSLRHLPHHTASGGIDLPHLKTWKNALARLSQTDLTTEDRAKAEKHLEAHAKAEGIGDRNEDKAATNGLDPQALSSNLERELSAVLEGIEW